MHRLEQWKSTSPGLSETLALPCTIFAGDTQIEIVSLEPSTKNDDCLTKIPIFGFVSTKDSLRLADSQLSPGPATLNSWFEALSRIQRSSASQTQFFKLAARAVFNPGGLDGCMILKRADSDWEIVTQHLPYPEYGVGYRQDLVDQSTTELAVLYHGAKNRDKDSTDCHHHSSVVCPVLDENGEVSAVVYGFRCNNRRNNRKGIRELEAKFVSLIADAVSAGLTRLSHEASGARRRVLLQQAFSPSVAEQLEQNPDFPTVENREVSVLFADIRSFCAITEKLGCHITYHLLSDVMDCFTQIIHQHGGVVIDYYGDGISAFWNAPVDIPDHPLMACQAGFAIVDSLQELNSRWMKQIGRRLRAGVGSRDGRSPDWQRRKSFETQVRSARHHGQHRQPN